MPGLHYSLGSLANAGAVLRYDVEDDANGLEIDISVDACTGVMGLGTACLSSLPGPFPIQILERTFDFGICRASEHRQATFSSNGTRGLFSMATSLDLHMPLPTTATIVTTCSPGLVPASYLSTHPPCQPTPVGGTAQNTAPNPSQCTHNRTARP